MKAIEKELKSCPFCGGEAVLKVESYYSCVKCKNCGAETGLVKVTPCICAVDEAAKVWNTRVDEPAAEVQEVKHGEWRENNKIYICSQCGYSFEHEGYLALFNYCPCCGARMDGERR